MENITIGQIETTLKIIAGIIGSLTIIFAVFSKWYQKKITNKFNEVDKRIKEVDKKIEEIESRLKYVEEKRAEYEQELNNSKKEREILMEGEWSALKLLWSLVDESKVEKEKIGKSIDKIEKYIMKKSHD